MCSLTQGGAVMPLFRHVLTRKVVWWRPALLAWALPSLYQKIYIINNVKLPSDFDHVAHLEHFGRLHTNTCAVAQMIYIDSRFPCYVRSLTLSSTLTNCWCATAKGAMHSYNDIFVWSTKDKRRPDCVYNISGVKRASRYISDHQTSCPLGLRPHELGVHFNHLNCFCRMFGYGGRCSVFVVHNSGS